MLIQQKQLRRIQRCHHQRQRLPLSAGQKADRLTHAVFQPHVQKGHPFPKSLFFRFGHRPQPAARSGRQCEIFLNRHSRCAPAHRILKQPSNLFGPLMLRHQRNIFMIQTDGSAVNYEAAGNGIE